jgi:hypothetical protein
MASIPESHVLYKTTFRFLLLSSRSVHKASTSTFLRFTGVSLRSPFEPTGILIELQSLFRYFHALRILARPVFDELQGLGGQRDPWDQHRTILTRREQTRANLALFHSWDSSAVQSFFSHLGDVRSGVDSSCDSGSLSGLIFTAHIEKPDAFLENEYGDLKRSPILSSDNHQFPNIPTFL